MADCFISYSRKDKDFARRLNEALKERGRTTSLDTQDLLPAEEWSSRLEAMIRESDNFVFVASPDSASSRECSREVEHAVSFQKRILPIVARDLDFSTLPPAVQAINAISFLNPGFEAGVESLLRAFDTDLVWVRSHSRLETRAAEWQSRGDDPSYLLRGSDLRSAESWLFQGEGKEIRPTELQVRYIQASRKDAKRRRQRAIVALAVALLVIAGLATLAEIKRRGEARQTQIASSRRLADSSRAEQDRNLDLSLLLGTAAWSVERTPEARNVLQSNLLERLVGILPLRSDFINGVVFSPDGRTLAVPEGKTIILWDVVHHRRLGQPFDGHQHRVSNIAFSPDGKILATVGLWDGTVFLWDVASHKALGRLPVGANATVTMAFSPNGKILATGSRDGTIILWDAGSGARLGQLAGHTQGVQSLAFSPNGEILASGGEDHIVILWDVQSRKSVGKVDWRSDGCNAPLMERRNVASLCSIMSVAFSPDGHTLASGIAAGTVVLWDVENSRTPRILGEPLGKHEKPVDSVAFSRNGGTLVSGSDDAIILWDVPRRKPEGNPLFAPRGVNLSSVVLGPDGKILAAGIARQTIMLWDLAGRILGEPLVGLSSIRSVAFSPDSRTLATVSEEITEAEISGDSTETVTLWDAARRTPLAEPLPHSSAVAFSPDGKTFATGSQDGTIILRDVARRKPLGEPLPKGERELSSRVSRMIFSPDGQILAVERDGGIQLWDIARRTPLKVQIEGFRGSFSPDSKILATIFGPIALWNVESGFSEPLGDEEPDALNIAFSPDGRTLASGSRLWDVARRAQIGGFAQNDRADFMSVAFSPDGEILASGGERGIVRFWDVARRAPLGESLNGFQEKIRHVCFSPDGKTLASVGGDGIVILWDVDPDSWSRRACFIAGRNLNCNEWRHYLLDEPYRKICPGLPGPERCD